MSASTTPGWECLIPGAEHDPYIDRVLDDEPYLTAPKVVVAHGVRAGIPWSLTMFEMAAERRPPEEGSWLDGRATIRFFEFFLGGVGLLGNVPGGFGGIGGVAELPPWAPHLSVVNATFEVPRRSAGTDLVSQDALKVLVVLTSRDVKGLGWGANGHRHDVEPLPTPAGYPTVSVFVADLPSPALEIVAVGSGGEVLTRQSWAGRQRA